MCKSLQTMKELEEVFEIAIDAKVKLSLFISMPGFQEPEIITNPAVNLEKKLQYYKDTYDDNLEHKHAKGVKILGW
ncbi:MAG TPA: hypothetical protein VFD00_03105 [Thermoclostridium sp.]|nr:hypothetical protein [Thermoclostridium sp.]